MKLSTCHNIKSIGKFGSNAIILWVSIISLKYTLEMLLLRAKFELNEEKNF